jgi:SAM-dependent methyltransferase
LCGDGKNYPPTAAATPTGGKRVNLISQESYVFGSSEPEVQRLIYQGGILRPITERLLRRVGIAPGMRVLDVGCGAGDVAMLAAELVGLGGRVVAVDRDPRVLAVAARRAQAALHQIEFRDNWASIFADGMLFDIVIGRYVLIHQSDPMGLIRALARLARRCGVVAFHEVSIQNVPWTVPSIPLLESARELVAGALLQSLPHHDAADRLAEHFVSAGLPFPDLFCESLMGGGPDCPLCGWAADLLRSLAPKLTEMGIDVVARVGCLDSLGSRLSEAMAPANIQVRGPAQICAWVKV